MTQTQAGPASPPTHPDAPAAPLVSIVIVTRDRPTLFPIAAKSVFDQDHRPIELVVVDNAGREPPRTPPTPPGVMLRTVRSEEPLNASRSRNLGAAHATGDFLGFLDDDDFYLPGKISAQLEALQADPSADFCIIDTEMRRGGETSMNRLRDVSDVRALLLYRPVHTNSLFIRMPVFRQEQLDGRLDKYTDLHLTYRLFSKYRATKAPGVGAVWMCDDRDDQITNARLITKFRDARRNARNWKIICDDFRHLIDGDATLRRKYYGRQAAFSLASFRPLEALAYGARALGGGKSGGSR